MWLGQLRLPGHLTYVSPNIEKLSGFSATEIVQDGVRLFRDGDNPDARRARASLEALFSRGEAYDLECRGSGLGERIVCEFRAARHLEAGDARFKEARQFFRVQTPVRLE